MSQPPEVKLDAEGVPRRREWRTAGIIFFSLIALAILWAAFEIIQPFLSAIILGAVLVTVTFGLFDRVRRRLHGRSSMAALVMLLGITFLLIVPAVVIGTLLVQQATTLFQHLGSGEAQQFMSRLDLASRLAWIRRIVPSFDPATLDPRNAILPLVRQMPSWVARNGAVVLGGLAGLVIEFFLVLLSCYFFYVEGEAILEQLTILSPLPTRYDREFAHTFKDVIDATFRGHVITGLVQGVVTTIGLAIAQVPGAFFWGAVATVLSLLPMVGAAAVWIPAAIYLYVAAGMSNAPMWHAVFLTAWGVLVVSLVDNVIRPIVMRGKSQLPAIPLLFAVLGGMQAFGFIGLVIGPLVFSLLMSIIDIYKRSFRLARSASNVA
jgi:predicted PurR-regulated permease PerM